MNTLASMLGAIYVLSEAALSIAKRARIGQSQLADRGSLWLLWIIIGCSVSQAFSAGYAFPSFALRGLAGPAAAVGSLLFCVGLVIRWYAIIYLGRFFTVNVAIAHDHRLIDGGPYRHIRHPSYTGALMGFLGLGLCMGNWLSLAIIAVPIALVFLWRIRVEEAALLAGLGDPYRNYMERTKRLIPGIY